MTTIVGQDKEYQFSGSSHGIRYTWQFAGKQVKNSVAQKLGLTLQQNVLQNIKRAANDAPYALAINVQDFALAAQPTLAITIPEKWHANHVVAVVKEHNQLHELPTAQAAIKTSAKKTILSFKLNITGRKIYLVAGQTTNKKLITQNKINETRTKLAVIQKESTKKSGKKITSAKANTGQPTKTASTKNSNAVTSTESSSTETVHKQARQQVKTVTISIECATLIGHTADVKEAKRAFVPQSGVILAPTTINLNKGDSVYDILVRATKKYGIQMESSYTPIYSSYYIEGINQLYEFDAGSLSGWMYSVNGWFPNYGVSEYTSLKNGDSISFSYTRNVGHDLGK
ncbi:MULTISPECIES: DUF4430 domain-containing protein [Amylolactobacillus]|nr:MULTISPECIES: DUF4430 domain-containing protein [Amylolactobacillus]